MIRYNSDDSIFPDYWVTPKRKIRVTGLENLALKEKCEAAILHELRKYPLILLKKELDHIYILGSIAIGDQNAPLGGTNSYRDVFLATNYPRTHEETAECVRSNFNHELSSILLRNHSMDFDESAWLKCNPNGFKYVGSGPAVAGDPRYNLRFNVLCAKNGFISAYAETSQEDDFNCVVQHLFDGEWPSNIDEYPQLKKKFEIAMEFYHKLDAQFDTHFFESLRTK